MSKHDSRPVKPPSFGPQGPRDKHESPVHAPRHELQGPAKREPSPVKLPDHRFVAKDSKMPQPPAAREPGKGSIPIEPFTVQGLPSKAKPDPDDIMPRSIAK